MARAAAQTWDPERYARNAHFVSELAGPLLGLVAAKPGERILDLGCGDGALTKQLVDLGCDVLGVDSSAAQIDACRRRGLACEVVDGEQLAFDRQFDAVFSNAALHWMRDVDAVLRGVMAALKPGGRFVGEFGGHGCVAAIRTALHAELASLGVDGAALEPWYFPTAQAYGARLLKAGFDVGYVELIPRPTALPTGMRGWLETFTESFLRPVDVAQREPLIERVIARLEPILRDESGHWTADYTRVRFAASRPS